MSIPEPGLAGRRLRLKHLTAEKSMVDGGEPERVLALRAEFG